MAEEYTPSIKPRAGLMRGARLWADPEGILVSPFMEGPEQMGYVLVYGEEEPAVFDGTNWHPILEDGKNWFELDQLIAAQYYKILDFAEKHEVYKELASYVTGNARPAE